MGTQTLLMAALVSMTVVALMIAINSRGRWRATLSSLLALGLLGGTTWVFILQYSIGSDGDAVPLAAFRDIVERPHAKQEQAADDGSATCSAMIARMSDFAGALMQERLHDPALSHEQLVARAVGVEQRFETLQSEMNRRKRAIDSIPEAARLLEHAVADLKAACHLYNTYYFAENSEAEQSIERLFRQKTRSARDSLNKAGQALAVKK